MFNVVRKRVVLLPLMRTRSLASVSSSSPINPNSVGPFQVFDRNAKRIQKDRSAARDEGGRSRTVDYVREEVADRLIERMQVRARSMSLFPDRRIMEGYKTQIQHCP